MLRKVLVFGFLLAVCAAAEPLPDLRTDPVNGGSVFTIHNTGSQPLTSYLIELVNYPGSHYTLLVEDLAAPLAPGAEKKIPVANMTVGAVPDYVKITAAIYADGASAGAPEKVQQIVERRRTLLATTRELIHRLEAKTPKPDVTAALNQWADSLQPQAKNSRTPAVLNPVASQIILIHDTAKQIENGSVEQALAGLRSSEKLLAASKPAR